MPEFVRPEAPGFELVRRGYHPDQVDRRIAKLVSDRDSALAGVAKLERLVVQRADSDWSGASGQALIADAYRQAERQLFERQTRSAPGPETFELVRRGYDRAQVDQRVAELVTERHLAHVRIGALERLVRELDEQRRRG